MPRFAAAGVLMPSRYLILTTTTCTGCLGILCSRTMVSGERIFSVVGVCLGWWIVLRNSAHWASLLKHRTGMLEKASLKGVVVFPSRQSTLLAGRFFHRRH